MEARYAECLEACTACAASCEHCASACLGEDDVAMMARCIRLDRYCADICRLVAAYMARSLGGHDRVVLGACVLCAEICDQCAEECGKHAYGHCRDCAEACRKCAAACRAMAA